MFGTIERLCEQRVAQLTAKPGTGRSKAAIALSCDLNFSSHKRSERHGDARRSKRLW